MTAASAAEVADLAPERLFPQPVQPYRSGPVKMRALAPEGLAPRSEKASTKPVLGPEFDRKRHFENYLNWDFDCHTHIPA
jgi:hypothetical protein